MKKLLLCLTEKTENGFAIQHDEKVGFKINWNGEKAEEKK